MPEIHRREVLAACGLSIGAALAGCLDEEGEEFLVTNTQITVERPSSILVRVTIENISPDRQTGTLEMELSYHADGDETTDPEETWRKTDDVEVKQAASPQLEYVFESAYQEGNDIENYALDAELVAEEL